MNGYLGSFWAFLSLQSFCQSSFLLGASRLPISLVAVPGKHLQRAPTDNFYLQEGELPKNLPNNREDWQILAANKVNLPPEIRVKVSQPKSSRPISFIRKSLTFWQISKSAVEGGAAAAGR